MRIQYITKQLHQRSMILVEQANEIIGEFLDLGYVLTLRQLYYQLVARDLIANRQAEYKRLGTIVADARMLGLIDWGAIEDRGRNLQTLASWDSPKEIMRAIAEQFRHDLWDGQAHRIEVWVEKQALEGVVASICEPLRVPYLACRGYMSVSEMWSAAHERFQHYVPQGQTPVVVHLGDHDPSGIDMTRDIEERLRLFGADVTVERIALNLDQVREYNPPPNPAKETDTRFADYEDRFGDESWELDALEPSVLDEIITETVAIYRDEKKWAMDLAEEKRDLGQIQSVAGRFDEVVAMLGGDA